MLKQPPLENTLTASSHETHLQAGLQPRLGAWADLLLIRNQIDLWITHIGEIGGTLFGVYERRLGAEERARYRSYCFDKDRRRFLATRTLAQTVLARYLGRQPEGLSFRAGVHGRPELETESPSSAGLSFNLSHTDDLVVLAVTRAGVIGVDVEARVRRRSLQAVCNNFLSRAEQQSLTALSPACREERLLALWTLKEAYTKARGLGLALPLRQIAFDFSCGTCLNAFFGPDVEDTADRWRFYLLRNDAGHIFSLCVERGTGAEQGFAVRKIIPFHSEKICRLSLLQASR